MNGKENIINKILSDADVKCARILADAEESAKQIRSNAESEVEQNKRASIERAEKLKEERVRNRIATAELDARKHRLSEKQRLISACFDKAFEHFVRLSDKDKQAFVVDLLKRYADEGEVVIIAKADKDVITQKTLDSVNKKLILGKSYHNEKGGVILEGKGYDKDLTLPQIIAHLRDNAESKVAAALFGE